MTDDIGDGARSVIEAREIRPPSEVRPLTARAAQLGPILSARKILKTYDPDDWEIFIEEWATALTPKFAAVRRFGGTGDKGVDVAGFHTDRGFEAAWQCFQGKHYARSLTPSVAWPEILKVFLMVLDNAPYVLPEKYYFLAPEGVGTGLGHLLSVPTALQSGFLKQLDSPKSKPFTDLDVQRRAQVRALASTTDFAMFTSLEVRDLIEQHRATPFHASRFGGGLPLRPAPAPTPVVVGPTESVYIQKLIEAYEESYHTGVSTVSEVSYHSGAGRHFQRQRESFFRAEALRRFARDSVPENTFEGLQGEIYDAIVETVESEHPSGLERLRAVLDRAVTAQLTTNALINVTEPADRKGICHQLANDDRVTWIAAT